LPDILQFVARIRILFKIKYRTDTISLYIKKSNLVRRPVGGGNQAVLENALFG
jgi:hypothetical protein